MDLRQFHNALRIMLNIDRHELVKAGVIDSNAPAGWERFRDDPFRWLIHADTTHAKRLWALMATRMPDRTDHEYEIYKDARGDWRWRCRSTKGSKNIRFACTEGYRNKGDMMNCLTAARDCDIFTRVIDLTESKS